MYDGMKKMSRKNSKRKKRGSVLLPFFLFTLFLLSFAFFRRDHVPKQLKRQDGGTRALLQFRK